MEVVFLAVLEVLEGALQEQQQLWWHESLDDVERCQPLAFCGQYSFPACPSPSLSTKLR